MSNNSINIDQLNDAIRGVLDEYHEDIVNGVKRDTKDAMKDLVKKTKDTAPVGKRSKHYRDSISSKKLHETLTGVVYLWYVRGSDYRLSHLLNNGHQLRDGGRYPGTNFIGKAVEKIISSYVEKIEETCKNGK